MLIHCNTLSSDRLLTFDLYVYVLFRLTITPNYQLIKRENDDKPFRSEHRMFLLTPKGNRFQIDVTTVTLYEKFARGERYNIFA